MKAERFLSIRWRVAAILALGLLLALLGASCGGDDESTPTPVPTFNTRCFQARLDAITNPTLLSDFSISLACGNTNYNNLFAQERLNEDAQRSLCSAVGLGSKVAPGLAKEVTRLDLPWLEPLAFAADVLCPLYSGYLAPIITGIGQ